MNGTNPYRVRMPADLVDDLRRLAREEALRRDSEVTWAGLLREAALDLVNRRQPHDNLVGR
jgi:hypothetical protein